MNDTAGVGLGGGGRRHGPGAIARVGLPAARVPRAGGRVGGEGDPNGQARSERRSSGSSGTALRRVRISRNPNAVTNWLAAAARRAVVLDEPDNRFMALPCSSRAAAARAVRRLAVAAAIWLGGRRASWLKIIGMKELHRTRSRSTSRSSRPPGSLRGGGLPTMAGAEPENHLLARHRFPASHLLGSTPDARVRSVSWSSHSARSCSWPPTTSRTWSCFTRCTGWPRRTSRLPWPDSTTTRYAGRKATGRSP